MPMVERDKMPMPCREPAERVHDFLEVPTGYTLEMAVSEAHRCLLCPEPLCEQGCPVAVPIRDFIMYLQQGDVAASIRRMKEVNSLPAICGRVCPQENQCEAVCVLPRSGRQAVAIGRLERFVADWERDNGLVPLNLPARQAQKVAVVGAGPAGLTCAGELAKRGYAVTVFEALHAPGGVLIYGIPEFRLPKQIIFDDVARLEQMGVEMRYNVIIGRTLTVDDLLGKMGYAAVFIGTGAGLPRFPGLPGENLCGIYSANEFLTRINLLRADRFPAHDTPVTVGRRVVVIGAGDTAMDAVRTALRSGAAEAHIVYRRSQAEMSAREEEYEHAVEEGVQLHWLTNPVHFLGDDAGWVTGVECVRMQLGEPDDSGRRRPLPVPGSNFVLDADTVIFALGTSPNPVLSRTTPGLEVDDRGCIVADPETFATSRPGVYAGGDIVTGAATVILAMGAGRTAAAAIAGHVKSRRGCAAATHTAY